jgi:hypothetical protein
VRRESGVRQEASFCQTVKLAGPPQASERQLPDDFGPSHLIKVRRGLPGQNLPMD